LDETGLFHINIIGVYIKKEKSWFENQLFLKVALPMLSFGENFGESFSKYIKLFQIKKSRWV
jgi:hypothetical protein